MQPKDEDPLLRFFKFCPSFADYRRKLEPQLVASKALSQAKQGTFKSNPQNCPSECLQVIDVGQ